MFRKLGWVGGDFLQLLARKAVLGLDCGQRKGTGLLLLQLGARTGLGQSMDHLLRGAVRPDKNTPNQPPTKTNNNTNTNNKTIKTTINDNKT